MGEASTARAFYAELNSASRDLVRYGSALVVVVGCFAGAAFWSASSEPDQDVSEVDNAVMIDLPRSEASSQPASDAEDGPPQDAVQASAGQTAPEQVEPKPVDELKPEDTPKPVETPPLPVEPRPAVVLEHKQEQAPPPKPFEAPQMAPQVAPQEALAPAGAEKPVTTDANEGDAGQPQASAHAITLWQKSLMRRLEAAKRLVGHIAHAAGTVRIAFALDQKGALASERIAASSGSEALDRAALLLVKEAAPFPTPPRGSADKDTSFVVPIRFR